MEKNGTSFLKRKSFLCEENLFSYVLVYLQEAISFTSDRKHAVQQLYYEK